MNTPASLATYVIDALGGTAAVARLCVIAKPSVTNWKKRGFPKSREMYFRVLRPDLFKADKQNKQDH